MFVVYDIDAIIGRFTPKGIYSLKPNRSLDKLNQTDILDNIQKVIDQFDNDFAVVSRKKPEKTQDVLKSLDFIEKIEQNFKFRYFQVKNADQILFNIFENMNEELDGFKNVNWNDKKYKHYNKEMFERFEKIKKKYDEYIKKRRECHLSKKLGIDNGSIIVDKETDNVTYVYHRYQDELYEKYMDYLFLRSYDELSFHSGILNSYISKDCNKILVVRFQHKNEKPSNPKSPKNVHEKYKYVNSKFFGFGVKNEYIRYVDVDMHENMTTEQLSDVCDRIYDESIEFSSS